MKNVIALALFATTVASAVAADPLDDLFAKYDGQVKQLEELKKAKDETADAIRKLLAGYVERAAKAGITKSNPPEPAQQPKPADPLKEKIKTAYGEDGSPRQHALVLSELYRQAADIARDPTVASTKHLLDTVRSAGTGLVPDNALLAVRKVVRDALKDALGESSALPITDAQRLAASELFTRLAAHVAAAANTD